MRQSALPLEELAKQANIPSARSVVYREECTQCFDSQDSPSGIDVCLTCFNGGCVHFKHASDHAQKTGHRLAMNVQRTRKPDSQHQRSPSAEPPLKKLAITEPPQDEYDLKTSVVYYDSTNERKQIPLSDVAEPRINQAVTAILSASSSAQASEVKAWEEEIQTCHHVLELNQDSNAAPVTQASATCHACELSSNLWLCLQCGSLGCGRPQYGGTGGNGHALHHYEQTGHCVNVKLGTITAEGTADLYCYSCDDARTDSLLQEHLAHFSIEIAKQEKTEKSMTELQVEHNLKFDFAMSGEEGRELHPIQGPGFTGLKNLGNSCYIASVLQVLFALPPFQKRYYQGIFELHGATCEAANPADCFDCQMCKIAHGLLSGRYAVSSCSSQENGTRNQGQDGTSAVKSFQEGIKPVMFKSFVGKGHPEFSTMRQQDADEFMRYLFQFIQRQGRQNPAKAALLSATLAEDELDPTGPFRFELEEKLQCTSCQCVRYRYEEQEALSLPVPATPVPSSTEAASTDSATPAQKAYQPVSLEQCLESFTTPQTVEYNCPRCKCKTTALTTSRIASFPKYLAIHMRRFAIVNWVPKKLEIPVVIPGHQVNLDKYFGSGIQPGEETLPEAEEREPEISVNADTLAALESMGFPTSKCRKAIRETGDSGVESATSWLFEHMDDVEVDEPTPAAQVSHNEEHVAMLMDMGFTANQAKKALGETDGNVERAVEWLFSHPDDDGTVTSNGTTAQDAQPGASARQERTGPSHGDTALPATFKLKSFISHKGPSVFSGHYVAHVHSHHHQPSILMPSESSSPSSPPEKKDHWVLFNDEKVAVAEQGALSYETMAPFAYIYLFERSEEKN